MAGFEESVVTLLAGGTLLTESVILLYLFLSAVNYFTDSGFLKRFSDINEFIDRGYREIGLLIAGVATSGSLYLSTVLGWTPCRLCWYQRIFMYPLVLLFAVSLLLNREKVTDYTLPMSIIGFVIAVYHYLVQFLSQVQAQGCSITQVSCETKYTIYFGHISIPTMAAAAFAAIAIISYRKFREN